jgi:methyl-accepting chemotaxis protein
MIEGREFSMSFLDNMKVAQKLAIGFGVCLFLAVLAVIIAITRMNSMNSNTTIIVNQANAETVAAGQIAADFRQYRVNQFRFIVAQDKKDKDEQLATMNTRKNDVAQDIDSYDKLATDPSDRANLDKVRDEWQKCLSFEPAIDAASRANNMKACDRIINHEADQFFTALREATVSMIDWNTKRTKGLAVEAKATYESARMTMIVLLGIALVIGIAMGMLITRTIEQSLHVFAERMDGLSLGLSDLVESLKAMGDGDLTARDVRHTEFLHWTRKDEFGDMSRVFDTMLEHCKSTAQGAAAARSSLSHLIVQARNAAEQIAAASDQIASGNEDLASRTSEQASSLEETAASMEEMTSIVKQSAVNAQNASSVVKESADQAEHANTVADESKSIAIAGGEVVEKAIESMHGIEESSKKIAEIVSVIDDIAFQTNLLALNAAVEAARVGEQGKGFAVVAAEVRSLAGRSSTAAKEIKTLVQDSVAKVERGSEQVNKSGDQLRRIVESGEKVAEIVAKISTASVNISDIVANISAASQEQSAGIEQVNKAITQMDEITQQNSALVEESASASEEMSQQAKELRDLVHQFKIDESMVESAPKSVSRIEAPARATGTHGAPAAPRQSASKPALKIVRGRAKDTDMKEF